MYQQEQEIIIAFSNNPSPSNMQRLISIALQNEISDEGIVLLAEKLAKSGTVLKYNIKEKIGDVPSTGGPSSLTTLICPLVLAELNIYVPKLGIEGRPAGGIDVLSQIPNYNILFTEKQIYTCLEESKYCHFLVDKNFAPLDKLFFKYRSENNAKGISSLVIASILSKKIAAGLNLIGLDVRISPNGNLGSSWKEAKDNSIRFVRIASKIGIKAKCYLTNNNTLLQPYFGRGESLIALSEIFNNEDVGDLRNHKLFCIDIARNLAEINGLKNQSEINVYKRFEKNLIAQGSSLNLFIEKVTNLKTDHTGTLEADKNGVFLINIFKLRDIIVLFQQEQKNSNSIFSDPCGVIFQKKDKDFVTRNEIILTYRVIPSIKERFVKALKECLQINENFQLNNKFQIIE